MPNKESGEFDNNRSLEDLRANIDEIDDKLVDLLNARADAVLSIAGLKRASGQYGYDTRREAEIIGRVMQRNKGPLQMNRMTRIFITILDQSKELLYEQMEVDHDDK